MCLGAMGPLICYFVGGITGGVAGTRYVAQKYGSEESSHHGFVGASGGILAFITAVSICDPSTRIGLLFLVGLCIFQCPVIATCRANICTFSHGAFRAH